MKNQTIATIATIVMIAGIVINFTAGIMLFTHLLNTVGFGKMMMMSNFGMLVEVYNSNPSYALTIIAISVVGLVSCISSHIALNMSKVIR